MATVNAMDAAVRDWTEALGPEQVAADEQTLARYARTTQAAAPRPGCVLYPRTTEEVQAIVRVAAAHKAPLYPISRGKNWGYGDACPTVDGAAVVDLSRMDRILEVNTDLAYCVIEPGVSQQQLHEHLRQNNARLWMDATAAGPESSLVGNTVDRGFGHTRYGDHFLSCCGMEVVLPDARVLRTGFWHYDNARAKYVYRYGVGPFLDGLFGQSNLGIVTKIGLWLMPEPEAFNFFYFQAPREEDIAEIIDRLRPLRLQGVLQTAIHIGNDFRVLAGGGRYPWPEAGGRAPLPDDVRMAMRRRTGMMAWNGSGSLSGTAGSVRAGRRALRQALRGLATVRFVDDRRLERAERLAHALRWTQRGRVWATKLETVRYNYELLKGIPNIEPLKGPQWRLRRPPQGPGDPLDSGCGLYWVSPTLPMLGSEVNDLFRLVKPIFAAHGFDMIVSLVMLTERSLVGIFNIAFDKSVEGEPEQASACYHALVDALHAHGFYIYRAGLEGMPKLHTAPSVFWDVATEIKRLLDPDDIIAPGRYIPPLFPNGR